MNICLPLIMTLIIPKWLSSTWGSLSVTTKKSPSATMSERKWTSYCEKLRLMRDPTYSNRYHWASLLVFRPVLLVGIIAKVTSSPLLNVFVTRPSAGSNLPEYKPVESQGYTTGWITIGERQVSTKFATWEPLLVCYSSSWRTLQVTTLTDLRWLTQAVKKVSSICTIQSKTFETP